MFNLIKKVLIVSVLSTIFSTNIIANPKGASIVSGDITIKNESPKKLGITQKTNKGIINWKSFDIDINEHTQFYQPNSNSITLNRVISNDPSKILGKLSANGQIMLINQQGFLFGKNSVVDVAGLVATTHDIKNEDFLNNKFEFLKSGKPNASIINLGKISIKDEGYAAFVAPYVQNRGYVIAKLGKVALASTDKFTLDLYGDELIKFSVNESIIEEAYDLEGNKLTSLVDNQGKIEANGGYVILTANTINEITKSVVNQSGIIEATSIEEKNGEIILSGGNKGIVSNSGSLIATNSNGTGGRVEITGEKIGLYSGTNVDVSGSDGGGTVLIGGDYLGGTASKETYEKLGIEKEKKDIKTATFLNMAKDAQIKANAIDNGNGGKIVLWSDNTTRAYGTILANGGLYSGDGGFIEVSGKKYLDIYNINTQAKSYNGLSGTILFDPADIEIVSPSNANASYDVTDFTSSGPSYTTTKISSGNIEYILNQGTNVIIRGTSEGPSVDSNGNIFVNDSIHKSSGGDAMLSLFSADEIIIDSNVSIYSTSGKLDIYMDADYDRHGVGYIELKYDSSIKTNGGFVNLNYSQLVNNGFIDTKNYYTGEEGKVREAHDYFEHTDFTELRQITTPSLSDVIGDSEDISLPDENVEENTGQGQTLPEGNINEFDSELFFKENTNGLTNKIKDFLKKIFYDNPNNNIPPNFLDFNLWKSKYGETAELEYLYSFKKDYLKKSQLYSALDTVFSKDSVGNIILSPTKINGNEYFDKFLGNKLDKESYSILKSYIAYKDGKQSLPSLSFQITASGLSILVNPLVVQVEDTINNFIDIGTSTSKFVYSNTTPKFIQALTSTIIDGADNLTKEQRDKLKESIREGTDEFIDSVGETIDNLYEKNPAYALNFEASIKIASVSSEVTSFGKIKKLESFKFSSIISSKGKITPKIETNYIKASDIRDNALIIKPDSSIQSKVNDIVLNGDKKGDKTESLMSDLFESKGYKTDYNGKYNNKDNGFDGIYVKGDEVIIMETKQMNGYGISLSKANPDSGLAPQMSNDWIKDTAKKIKYKAMELKDPIKKQKDIDTANMILKALKDKKIKKYVSAVDKSSGNINIIQLQ